MRIKSHYGTGDSRVTLCKMFGNDRWKMSVFKLLLVSMLYKRHDLILK